MATRECPAAARCGAQREEGELRPISGSDLGAQVSDVGLDREASVTRGTLPREPRGMDSFRSACVVGPQPALATFSADAQPARSPLLIAKAIISGNASGVQANAGMPMAAIVLAMSWS